MPVVFVMVVAKLPAQSVLISVLDVMKEDHSNIVFLWRNVL